MNKRDFIDYCKEEYDVNITIIPCSEEEADSFYSLFSEFYDLIYSNDDDYKGG